VYADLALQRFSDFFAFETLLFDFLDCQLDAWYVCGNIDRTVGSFSDGFVIETQVWELDIG